MDLKGKVAIVTGAGRGVGKEISISLASSGCNLTINSRTREELEKLKVETEKSGIKTIVFPYDLSEINNIRIIVKETLNCFNKIDMPINNVGILVSSNLLENTEEEWFKTIDINLRAAFFLSQEVLKQMIKQRSGYIINNLQL